MSKLQNKKLRRAETIVAYEQAIAEWSGAEYAITVSSGTTSLHIALVAFGPGDEVIVGPYTFIASDTRLLEQTTTFVFADTDPITSLWIHKMWKGSVRANRTGLQREFLAGERPPIARKTRSELYRCGRAHSCNGGPR